MTKKDEDIGGVEAYINLEGEFRSVVKVNPEYQGEDIGFKAFEKAYNELNEHSKIKKIIGDWLMDEEKFPHCKDAKSSNLEFFSYCIGNNDDIFCAFSTPTGKWAAKLGFKKCKVLRKSPVHVTVEFFE